MRLKASFDDGTIEDIKAAKLMKKYGIQTIFYWPVYPKFANKDRESLSEDQMQKIAKDFEIGSHTLTHPLLTRIPIEEAETEINESRKLLRQKFNQEINSFCYPRGYSNPAIQELVVNAGYLSARSTLVGYIHESENLFFEQTAVHIGYNRKEYAGLDWYDYGLKLLEIAQKVPNSVFHMFGHSWEIEENNQWSKFEKFLKEVTK